MKLQKLFEQFERKTPRMPFVKGARGAVTAKDGVKTTNFKFLKKNGKKT